MAIFVMNVVTSDLAAPDLFVPNGKSWRVMAISGNQGFPLRVEIDAPEAVGGNIFTQTLGRAFDVQMVAAIGATPAVDENLPSSTHNLPDFTLPQGSNVLLVPAPGSGTNVTVRLLISESANIL